MNNEWWYSLSVYLILLVCLVGNVLVVGALLSSWLFGWPA